MLGQGLGSLQRAPQFQELTDQVRGELLTAGRAAVTAAANRRLTTFADTLRDRTDALTGEDRRDDDSDENGDEDAYFDEEDRAEDRRPAPAPPRKTAKKAAPRKAAPPAKKAAKKTAAKKTAPGKRAAGRASGAGVGGHDPDRKGDGGPSPSATSRTPWAATCPPRGTDSSAGRGTGSAR